MKIVRGASSGARARSCWMKFKRSSGGVASKSMSRVLNKMVYDRGRGKDNSNNEYRGGG